MVLRNPFTNQTPQIPRPDALLQMIKRGEHKVAQEQLSQILRLAPSQAKANYLMALSLAESGQKSKALPYAERAYAGDPKTTDHVFFLGRLYVDVLLLELAYPLLKKALAEAPRSFLILWAMAKYFHQIQRGEKAKEFYERAAQEAPSRAHKAVVEMELTSCLADLGEKEAAERLLINLEKLPDYRDIAMLARGFLGSASPDSDLANSIRNFIQSGRATLLLCMDGLLALGRFEEAAENYDAAFALWRKARSLAGVKNHSPAKLNAMFAGKSRFYTTSLFAETYRFTDQDDRLLFVVGMPRSGTTLTEQVLSAHPDCVGVGETQRMEKLATDFHRSYSTIDSVPKLVENAKRGELKARGEENIRFFEAITEGGWQRAVEKTPFNFESMGYIHLVHPNARFIHLRRHPADSFISAFQNRMNPQNDYAYDQIAYLERYTAKEKMMSHWKSCFPERILEVKYEDFVNDPETHVRQMLEFVGLPWDEACMKFFERQTMVRTFSRDQVRKSFYTSSVGRWKNYEKHLKPMFGAMAAAKFEY
jgi:tetratricopeptide (TPR) repeat protein